MNPQYFLLFLLTATFSLTASAEGKHLFILSGQSNMVGMNPELSFIPILEKEFGKENLIIVKDAQGGKPIRLWYKAWKPKNGSIPKNQNSAWLYERLIKKVSAAIKGESLASVTFIWMQGERDAREQHGEVYAESLVGLIQQLENELHQGSINFVIGRLSDMDMENKRYPHWTLVREAQVKVAEASENGAWIDTDDLPMKKDNLHYNEEGYIKMGQRFAEKAIELIRVKSD